MPLIEVTQSRYVSATIRLDSEIHAAMFINNTDWDSLAESLISVNKSVFYSLAQDARLHANSDAHFGNPKAKEFWNSMADFYQWQAER